MNILYEDASIVVLDKPAGLSSEEGVPAALRQRWNAPDAFVGVVHRLDTGVSGLMVFARTPGAAAALSRQITQSQNAYAVQDGRAEGRAEEPQFIKQYRAAIAGGPDEALPAEGTLRDWLFKDSRRGRVFGQPPPQGRAGSRSGISHPENSRGHEPCGHHSAHRPHPSDPGAVCRPEASALRRRQVWQPGKGRHRSAELRPAVPASGYRQAPAVQPAPAGRRTVERVFRMMHRLTAI